MIQGKLIEYGEDLLEITSIWKSVFPQEMKDVTLCWGDEIAIYGVIYNENYIPIGAGKLIFSKGKYILEKIGVLENERNKGYGDFVTKLLVNKAFMSGSDSIYVTPTQECVNFFTGLGFEFIKENSDIQKNGSMILFTGNLCRKCSKL